MRKFIDADRLKENVDRRMTDNLEAGKQIDKNTTSGTAEAGNYFAGAAKEDYEILSTIESLQEEQPATAVGKVFTNPKPMNIIVENEQWEKLLGQFDNGQRVRIILIAEDDAE